MEKTMKTKVLSFVLALALVVLFGQIAMSQSAQFQIPMTVASGGPSQVLLIGVSGDGANPPGTIMDNTIGADTDPSFGTYQEALAPPAPPAPFAFDARIVTIPGRVSTFPTGLGGGVYKDFRGFFSSAQVDSFKIVIAGDNTDNGPTTVSWPSNLNLYGTSWTIKPQAGTDWPTTNMLTSTSVEIPAGLHKNIIIIKTGAFNPAPGPTFVLSPTSLNFGTVAVGNSSTLSVTVSNTGITNALSITGITSIGNYTVAPNTFPIAVAPGASQSFDVTFSPTAAGNSSGNIVFTHNAPNSPTDLAVTGSGIIVIPVTFELSPTSLNLGDVISGGSVSQQVTVSNGGTTTTLAISGATVPAMYSISPAAFPVNIAPGASQTFTVTFAPTAVGTFSGNIVFTHNAPNSPTNLAVTGTGLAQGGTLQFAAALRVRLDHSYNHMDSLQLVYGGAPLKAFQFWVVLKGLLRVQSVERGASIADPSRYAFAYNLVRGPLAADSSSNDTIKAVIYGVGNNTLAPGTYSNVMKFAYNVSNIVDSVRTTSIDLIRVFSSLSDGTPAGVTSGGPQQVTILNKTYQFRGDVNGDDYIDILDLLLIVDHIIERTPLTGRSFMRADVYQWPNGDGVVNVQDLAVLQNMILTGQYPDGIIFSPVGGGNVIASNRVSQVDARLTFHVTSTGIDVRMENSVAVRGLQVDFTQLATAPVNINITTLLGQGFQYFNNGILRVLLYDQSGYTVVEPGDRIVARIPFSIVDPASLRLGYLVLAGANNNRIDSVEASISLTPTGVSEEQLPTEFALHQNYPNPFNPTTSIRFSVPQPSDVRISIYNMLGQEVRTLFAGQMDRGTKTLEWDGKDNAGRGMSSGSYVYRMVAGSFVESHKMLLLK